MISQSVVNELMSKLKAAPLYDDVVNIGLRNSYNSFYLVGGKVYRGLAEIIHGDVRGFNSCDWDILVMGKPYNIWLPRKFADDKWRWMGNHYADNSLCCKHYKHSYVGRGSVETTKMDIISIDDVKEDKTAKGTLEDYYKGVPLDIQAIALDLTNSALYGPGISAVIQGRIAISGQGTIFEKNYDPNYVTDMLVNKATSMLFDYTNTLSTPAKCTCYANDPRMLLFFGCRCGGK